MVVQGFYCKAAVTTTPATKNLNHTLLQQFMYYLRKIIFTDSSPEYTKHSNVVTHLEPRRHLDAHQNKVKVSRDGKAALSASLKINGNNKSFRRHSSDVSSFSNDARSKLLNSRRNN